MKSLSKRVLGTAAGLIVVFAFGWIGGSAWMQMKSDTQKNDNLVNVWGSYVELLTQNTATNKVLSPSQVAADLRTSLDTTSIRMAYIYDSLPQQQKNWIVRHLASARNVAISQQSGDGLQDRRHLLMFVSCVQKVRTEGGLVGKCFTNGMRTVSAAQSKNVSMTHTASTVGNRRLRVD